MRHLAYWLFIFYVAALVYGIAMIVSPWVAIGFAVFVGIPGIALFAAAIVGGDDEH